MSQCDVYVYGILKGMRDDETVRFAAACAAVACTRFPSVREPQGYGRNHRID